MQRVVAEQSLVISEAAGMPVLFQEYQQPFRRPRAAWVKPLADRGDPVVVAVGEQVAGISGHGFFLQRLALRLAIGCLLRLLGAGQGRLEIGHIQREAASVRQRTVCRSNARQRSPSGSALAGDGARCAGCCAPDRRSYRARRRRRVVGGRWGCRGAGAGRPAETAGALGQAADWLAYPASAGSFPVNGP